MVCSFGKGLRKLLQPCAKASYLESFGVQYGLDGIPGKIVTKVDHHEVYIIGVPSNKDITLKYRWKTAENKGLSPFKQKLKLIQSDTLLVQPYKNDKLYGDEQMYYYAHHNALGTQPTFANPWAEQYKANGIVNLTDGRLGSTDFKDGAWQGFWDSDYSVNLSFDSLTSIRYIETHFYQYSNSWIFTPQSLSVYGSVNGIDYFPLGTIQGKTKPTQRGHIIETFNLNVAEVSVRYLKITAERVPRVPAWHEAAGSGTWLFTDEIIVR